MNILSNSEQHEWFFPQYYTNLSAKAAITVESMPPENKMATLAGEVMWL